jgi:UDP-glucose 4-epimerase
LICSAVIYLSTIFNRNLKAILANILLTGGTGYIGSHTAVALIEAGHTVVLYDNLSNSTTNILERLQLITDKKLTFIEGDTCDSGLLMLTLLAHQIDTVVHYAGLKLKQWANRLKNQFIIMLNIQGTIACFRQCSL